MIEVVMPEMGESVSEGTITRWLVAVGDTVDKDQPIVEISTDKVDAEIPSPAAGTVQEIRAEEGAVVQVESVLAVIATDGKGAARSGAPRADGSAREEPTDESEATEEDTAKAPPEAAGAVSGSGRGKAPQPGEDRVLATPIARRIATAQGVDLARVRGSGAQGRITKDDVVHAAEQRSSTAAVAAPTTAATPVTPRRPSPPAARPGATPGAASGAPATPRDTAPTPAGDFHVRPWVEGERVELEPMSRIRKLTARHMSYSQATSVHVTTLFHIDMTRIVQTRDRVKAAFEREHGTKLTFMPFIFRALAGALRSHPKFNAAID